MDIYVKNAPAEAHYCISIIEHYHRPLQQVYSIITFEISGIKPDLVLHIFFKDINNSMGLNGLIPILLIFGTYPRMTQ